MAEKAKMPAEAKKIEIPFDSIELDKYGLRNSRSAIPNTDKLRASIEAFGLLVPMVVWKPPGKDSYVLCCGYLRHKAITEIRSKDAKQYETIGVSLLDGVPLNDALCVNLEENIKRETLNHADLAARMFLLNHGRKMSETAIADKLNVSQGYVARLIGVHMNCIDEVLQALREGLISVQRAKELATLDPEEQLTHLEKLLDPEKAEEFRKRLAKKVGHSRPGIKVIQAQIKQLEKYEGDQDVGYRRGALAALRFSLGTAEEILLFHPPESASGSALKKTMKKPDKKKVAEKKFPTKKETKKKSAKKKKLVTKRSKS